MRVYEIERSDVLPAIGMNAGDTSRSEMKTRLKSEKKRSVASTESLASDVTELMNSALKFERGYVRDERQPESEKSPITRDGI